MNELTIDQLAGAIAQATFDVDAEGRAVARSLWDLLTAGQPVPVETVAAHAGVEVASVSARLEAWPGVFRDDGGNIVGFWGLALPRMSHRFRVEGGAPIHAWCALDPMLIVPILGRPARVESKDPLTGEAISMTVTPSGVEDVSPAGMVVSILIPDRAFDRDVIQSFCNFVHYFASQTTGEKWIAGRPGFALVSPREAFEIGRRAWSTFAQ